MLLGSPQISVMGNDEYVIPPAHEEPPPQPDIDTMQDDALNADSSFARTELDISALEEELNIHPVWLYFLLV